MKFAKELEEDLVPEWRVKYFNYKIGKKKIKAVSRALRSANRTPQINGGIHHTSHHDDELPFTHYDFNKRHEQEEHPSPLSRPKNGVRAQANPASTGSTVANSDPRANFDRKQSVTMFAHSPPVLTAKDKEEPETAHITEEEEDHPPVGESDPSSDSDHHRNNEQSPLHRHPNGAAIARRRYGSIVGTPPDEETLENLQLPDPALDPGKRRPLQSRGGSLQDHDPSSPTSKRLSRVPTGAEGYWDDQQGRKKTTSASTLPKRFFKKRQHRKGDPFSSKQKFKRAFTTFALDSPAVTTTQFEAYKELDAKQDEFFTFLDKELRKIENFYKMKEEESTSRLQVLREQLHEMRDRRLEDLKLARQGKKIADQDFLDGQIPVFSAPFQNGKANGHNPFQPVTEMFNKKPKIGKTSKAREELGSPRGSSRGVKTSKNDRGDYVRKQQPHEKVPYRFAKRKLKLALQEFYRGLELLKSYALLNRTAFRKINKKYDKAVMARPPLRYMTEKVNSAHFVQSTLVEEHLVNIEDLYARYFERGNRKVAINKLRSHLRSGDHSSESFRNGLYVAAGAGFAVSGLVNGVHHLFSDDPVKKTQASYLFQIYAGYLLSVLLFLFFVLDCRIWSIYRINYVFVFEYDTRHVLDWRQLAELPCFFLFLNGLFFWLNFQLSDTHPLYLWWPVFLIGFTVIFIFLPFKVLYYHSRKWWLYSNWRLMLAGLYPVEFRDFYLGDMYCSETYAMSQLEVFFCLYSHKWNNPAQCNSNHSRLLGFLTTLPPIWRAFQCLRRYYDSRNWFPHLANFAKYCCNILYYMSLSMYRIEMSGRFKAMFITLALVNGLYCSFWDVFMDFSLGNPWSKNFLLRDHLGFRRKRFYYGIMIVDVVLRQQWILYAIFTEDLQHSAVMSFFVALAEVIRRGLWSLFRVENEHCNNVEKFRASRDIPLPYSVPESRAGSVDYTRRNDQQPQSPESLRTDQNQSQPPRRTGTSATSTSADLERQRTSSSSLRSRRNNLFGQSTPGLRALQRVGTVIAAAHTQDFQKKKRSDGLVGRGPEDEPLMDRNWSDEEDEEDDENELENGSAQAHNRFLDSREDLSPGSRARRPASDDDGDEDDHADREVRLGDETEPEATDHDHDHDLDEGIESSSGTSATGSGGGRNRLRSERRERDASIMRRASDQNDADITDARDRVERARHQ